MCIIKTNHWISPLKIPFTDIYKIYISLLYLRHFVLYGFPLKTSPFLKLILKMNVVLTWSAVLESSCCSALQEKFPLRPPEARQSEKCDSLPGWEATDRSVFLWKGKPLQGRSHSSLLQSAHTVWCRHKFFQVSLFGHFPFTARSPSRWNTTRKSLSESLKVGLWECVDV